MSEDAPQYASLYELVHQTILGVATMPRTEQEEAFHTHRLNQAYQALGLNTDFRVVLGHWTEQVYMHPKVGELLAAQLVTETVQRIHLLNQYALGHHLKGDTRDGWER